MTMPWLFMESGAYISDCSLYRYTLSRRWDKDLDMVCWVMLNPSTADADQDDPTIRRCVGFTKQWGCGGMLVVNLYALRSTDPYALWQAEDPIGPENDMSIIACAAKCWRVMLAWGTQADPDRASHVVKLLKPYPLYCLGLTQRGQPRHPLYVKADQVPVEFKEVSR
jgi:hypothetical protein